METRRDVHYKGNTVKPPRPARKNREKRARMANRRDKPLRFMERKDKICAAEVCPWCGNKQTEVRIMCQFCRTCFYCGMQPDNAIDCNFCGNHLPKKLQRKRERRRITVR